MTRHHLLWLLVLGLGCAREREWSPTIPEAVAEEPAPAPAAEAVVRRWTPREVDRQPDLLAQGDSTAVLRAPVDALPQTRRFDFKRELLVAVGDNPGPDAPIVRVGAPELEATVAVIWHPVWVVRGCVGPLVGHESFQATTLNGPLWILYRPAAYVVPQRDAQFVVATVPVEVDCPADARELLARPIPPESIPAELRRDSPRLATYVVRERPEGEATGFEEVDFSRDVVVVGTDASLALPVRLIAPPAHALSVKRVAVYAAGFPVLACKRKLSCHSADGSACELDYDFVRRERYPAFARVPNRGQEPIVRRDTRDAVVDPDCGQQPRTFVVRSANDPRAPAGAAVDWSQEMLLGLDVGLTETPPTTVLAPVSAVAKGGSLRVVIDVPVDQEYRASGCEGARGRPCDPIAVPTGKVRVRADWAPLVAGAYYRVPRSDLPIQLRFRVPNRPAN